MRRCFKIHRPRLALTAADMLVWKQFYFRGVYLLRQKLYAHLKQKEVSTWI